jgi:hypothetical protein
MLFKNYQESFEQCIKAFLKRDIKVVFEVVNGNDLNKPLNTDLITIKVEEE